MTVIMSSRLLKGIVGAHSDGRMRCLGLPEPLLVPSLMPWTSCGQSILQRTHVLLVILLCVECVDAPCSLEGCKSGPRGRLRRIIRRVLRLTRLLAVGALVQPRRVLTERRQPRLCISASAYSIDLGTRARDTAFPLSWKKLWDGPKPSPTEKDLVGFREPLFQRTQKSCWPLG